ncbi:uncharacterized protein LOC108030237 isoform X11 [Drosophila biarmipes]|uniref:uncharacterized protein LOC108030237 isoform X11 n=1 Tax=Drosophila biarmipes TaxID=125945 RepID=UPI0021CCA660|nr:uncharacterized protein LOC108030237 isoform X11 [Drosophila biarmipes]
MYVEFWFFGFVVLIVVSLAARECYLFVKLKIDEWNMRVHARLLRHEMMLRLAMEAVLQEPEKHRFRGFRCRECFGGGRVPRPPGQCVQCAGGAFCQPLRRHILH